VPYTQTTETTLAMCSKRGGTERVLHGVKFPEGAVWSYDSASMGRCPDWAGESVFWELDGEPVGVPYGSDASKLSRHGLDCIVFGPGSIDQAHGAVEYVDISQVEQAAEFYREFSRRYE
jgi:hypothetical protein